MSYFGQRCLVSAGFGNIQERINFCCLKLSAWGNLFRLKFRAKLKACRDKIQALKYQRTAASSTRVLEAQKELGILLNQQETYWKQRSKQHWLGAGDANTKFFHQYASVRRKKNRISKLRDGAGAWRRDSGLADLIRSYFEDIFWSRGSVNSEILGYVKCRISDEQNAALLKPFEAEEIKASLFSMHPDKAPGPDGMNPAFFQNFWDITGA